jgi:saccharopine dehydrogenase-like NADP-dependent oxidoreductase
VVLETLSGVARRAADSAAGERFDHTMPVLAERVSRPRAAAPGRLRVLLVGAGGVGSALAVTASRRSYLETMVVADYDAEKANRCVDFLGDGRFVAERVDATDEAAVVELLRRYECDILVNATDPRFVMPLFPGPPLAGRVHYIDMAMSLSHPHPTDPYNLTGGQARRRAVRHGAAVAGCGPTGAGRAWGSNRGCPTSSPAMPRTRCSAGSTRSASGDGGNIEVEGHDFAPTFSIWTTIEECLNPPVVYEQGPGLVHHGTLLRAGGVHLPRGHRRGWSASTSSMRRCFLIPRWVPAARVTFKYGLGQEFIEILKVQHKLGIDSTEKIQVGGVAVSPRDVIAALLPDPATLGEKMHGKTCAGSWVRGLDKDGEPLEVYLYHVVDNDWSMREYNSQAVVWQTAVCPVVAMELIANGTWSGAGVLGPEAFQAEPFPGAPQRLRAGLGDPIREPTRTPRSARRGGGGLTRRSGGPPHWHCGRPFSPPVRRRTRPNIAVWDVDVGLRRGRAHQRHVVERGEQNPAIQRVEVQVLLQLEVVGGRRLRPIARWCG